MTKLKEEISFKTDKDKMYDDLYGCLCGVTDKEDMKKLLADLCTFNEVEQMTQRLLCAKLLLMGYTCNQIIEITDISSATLSRVSKCLRHGSGGYRDVVGAIVKKEKDDDGV